MDSSSSTIRQAKTEEHQQQPQKSAVETLYGAGYGNGDGDGNGDGNGNGNGDGDGDGNRGEQMAPSSSPDNFTNNSSMKSELEKIVFLDHCYDNQDTDENYLPENINRASLISRIRAIRGSAQMQYRMTKKRGSSSSKKQKSVDDMEVGDLAELSDEIVTIDRQKRVMKLPTRARSRTVDHGSPYDKRLRKSKKGRSKDSKQASLVTDALDLPETTT